jgi:hypothetical protein
MSAIPEQDVRDIESQAYKLAGLLLVPSSDLSREYMEVANTLSKSGLDITKLASESLRHVAKIIGAKFEVSSAVIHRCAVRDRLWEWDDIENT